MHAKLDFRRELQDLAGNRLTDAAAHSRSFLIRHFWRVGFGGGFRA